MTWIHTCRNRCTKISRLSSSSGTLNRLLTFGNFNFLFNKLYVTGIARRAIIAFANLETLEKCLLSLRTLWKSEFWKTEFLQRIWLTKSFDEYASFCLWHSWVVQATTVTKNCKTKCESKLTKCVKLHFDFFYYNVGLSFFIPSVITEVAVW